MSNKRFDEIIRQRNREQLEKTREYYSRPENREQLSPKLWKDFYAALSGEEFFVVYAPDYFILLPKYEEAIQEPIYQGMDVDDLFYFFDPDYILDNIGRIPRLVEPFDPDVRISASDMCKPFLLPLYAKYKVMTAGGFVEAPGYDLNVLDEQLEEELRKDKYNGKHLEDLVEEIQLDAQSIEDTALYKAIKSAFDALNENAIPKLRTLGSPQRYFAPNTYLSNALMGYTEKGEFIGIGGRNFKTLKNTRTYYCADWTGPDIQTYGKPWTEFDRSINNAVCSLKRWARDLNVPPIFTIDMIYRAANGKDSSYTVTEDNQAATEESLNKQNNFINITIDATEEMKARKVTYKGQAPDSFKITDHALHFRTINMMFGGTIVKAYDFSGDDPIMLIYAELTKQLLTFTPDMLDIKEVSDAGKIKDDSLPLNRDRMAIRDYLLRRWKTIKKAHDEAIEEYKRYVKRCQLNKKVPEYDLQHFIDNKRLAPVILFDTMFTDLQITEKNAKTRAKNFALDAFAYWKAKGKIDYQPRKKGKSYDAIQILFDK